MGIRPLNLIAWIALSVAGNLAAAQQTLPAPHETQAANSASAWIDLVPLPVIELDGPLVETSDLCGDKPGGGAWIDRMQARLYRTMCLSAARFDGFFGNARFDDEYEATHGSAALGALWDERDQFDPSVRFRLHMRLPQLSERFGAFVGRLDPDEYVTEARDDFDTLPRQFARRDDDAVLLGLGYSQPSRRGGNFAASVGAELGLPMNPYLKGTYRLAVPLFERNLLRLRETVFWQADERLGATTRVDLERLLTEAWLVRWTGSGTFTQETQGARWFSSLTLYQNLGGGRALAYQTGVSGESDREVPVTDYGLRVIYRRRITREWLFLELRSSLTWPRATLLERREANWGAGVAVELLFGERRT